MHSELGIFFSKDYFRDFRNLCCSYRRNFFLLEILIYKEEMRVNWWKSILILFKNASRKFIMYAF